MIQISIVEIDAALDYANTQASIEAHPEWGIQPDSKKFLGERLEFLRSKKLFRAKIISQNRQMNMQSSIFKIGEHEESIQELMSLMAKSISAELSHQNELPLSSPEESQKHEDKTISAVGDSQEAVRCRNDNKPADCGCSTNAEAAVLSSKD